MRDGGTGSFRILSVSYDIGSFMGVKVITAFAGLLGAVISLEYVRDLSRSRKAIAVLGGAAAASYGAPVLVYLFGFPLALESGIGFFVGLFGMSFAGLVFRSIDKMDIPGLIKLWRNK